MTVDRALSVALALTLLGCNEAPTPPDCRDADGDGWGDPDYGTEGCADPTPDCNDGDIYVYPGAEELCDGLDNDCDGTVPNDEVDGDGDGIAVCEGDCDDTDAHSFPGAPETCDGEDNDCDGVLAEDEADGDGDGHLGCADDCDDGDEAIHPGADEGCDGIDTDCDGSPGEAETDDDGDGASECDDDCDDTDATVYSGAAEICDGVDNDCDGSLAEDEVDADGDGWMVCAGDCDDDDAVTHPEAPEACDGIDNDCDGARPDDELDADGDGQMACCEDCDDGDATVFPGAEEACDGLDNDCDGAVPADEADDDGDGQMVCGGDCDDGNADVYIGALELCDGLDDDCNGQPAEDEDDDDGDGVMVCAGDCDDDDPDNYSTNVETCDGADNDCDGIADDGLANCGPPSIGAIDGDADALAVDDFQDLIDNIAQPQEALHRFEESWLVSGEHLDIVDGFLMEQTEGGASTFTDADGLAFEVGGTPTQRTLLLPQALAEGRFDLTLTNPAGQVTVDVYVLRGEPGAPGEDVLVCDGTDCTLDGDLAISGDLDAVGLTVEDGVDVDGVATFGALETDALTVTESVDLGPCPGGYALDEDETGFTLCERMDGSGDQVVAVGDFWIDRYEMSVWSESSCSGEQYGEITDGDDYPAGFPDTGNWEADSEAFACSIGGEMPSGYMTWFQAQQACALSGKSLCSNAQWQAAAAGTDVSACNTGGAGGEDGCDGVNDPWITGNDECGLEGCISTWGAMDMVGNLWEWVADWLGHPGYNAMWDLMSDEYGNDGYRAGGPSPADMPEWGTDGSWRPMSPGFDGHGDEPSEHFGPSALARGGAWSQISSAGVFALSMTWGPSYASGATHGARCCIER